MYTAWVRKYWGEQYEDRLQTLMNSIKNFDDGIHSLNDEFEKVNILKTANKIEPQKSKNAVTTLKPLFKTMYDQGKELAVSLE